MHFLQEGLKIFIFRQFSTYRTYFFRRLLYWPQQYGTNKQNQTYITRYLSC